MSRFPRAHLVTGHLLVLVAACSNAQAGGDDASPDRAVAADASVAAVDAEPAADAPPDASAEEPPAPPPPWDGFTPTGAGYATTLNPGGERGVSRTPRCGG